MADFIASRDEDYSKWYLDIITKAKLADYGPVKGCMVIMPYGFSIWQRIREELDLIFKETGHSNAYFPLLIPSSFFQREAEHIEGFAPEFALVTKVGEETLAEPLVLRPTSEAIIWSMYSKWIKSYRDLPIKINQWANVIRWEKKTKPFLRTTEFLWQEGHTAHQFEDEAREETLLMLKVYKSFLEETLAIPVFTGRKTEREKFAGAIETYSVEALLQDKKALQAGTSHFLGQNFSKAFNVKFQNDKEEMEYVWASSWGVSTRLIGALVMVHSDDNGLVLPPNVAPIQVLILVIFNKDANSNNEIISFAKNSLEKLKKAGFRAELDLDSKNSLGWRLNEAELRGIPIRLELGEREERDKVFVLARRDKDKSYKYKVNIDNLNDTIKKELEHLQDFLFNRALNFQKEHTKVIEARDGESFKDFLSFFNENSGFLFSTWCGKELCEKEIKDLTGVTIRCIPDKFKDKDLTNLKCVKCGETAKYYVLFAKSY